MPDPQYQDAITYEQPLRKEITEDQIQVFKDKNLFLVLDFLRANNQPMTVEDLEMNFEKIGEKKSIKSIYRYLKKLEDEKLVVQAGKRVYPLKNKLKTQTLYMRSAKIFFPVAKPRDDCTSNKEDQTEKMIEALGLLLSQRINGRLKSTECLTRLIEKIHQMQNDLTINLIDDAEEEIAEKIKTLDWKHTQSLLATVSLLTLLSEEKELYKDLSSCFE
jgi:DNA-binding PadR family transcriptional regulator